jgi:Short C-terminal domain
MFGRKRKKEDENLAGLGLPSPAGTAAPPTTGMPTSIPLTGYPTAMPAVLGQILGGNGPIGELIAQIKADPQGFRERMLQQAQAAGISTYVLTPQGMAATQGGAAPAHHVDVVEELTKAADLHDKGALTDAEFEALKKKLLAEG